MNLRLQKKLAASIFKASKKRVKFAQDKLEDLKELMLKDDIRGLIKQGVITLKQKKGVSRARAKKIAKQRTKGLRKGPGKRKGTKNARVPKKEQWMIKIRLQRSFLKELYTKNYISTKTYRDLYAKSKGGFFRSKRHIKLYIDDNNLAIKK